jgi:RNA polymerase sigma-70 factor (ECF subfamily)
MDRRAQTDLTLALRRLADGERAAFHPVFEAVWPLLLGFARRALPAGRYAPEDAEDAAQKALLRVFLRASEFDRRREALPWIVAIAANECRTIRRKASRRREELGAEGAAVEAASAAPSPEAEALDRDLWDAVVAVAGELRPEDQRTLLLALEGGGPEAGVNAATFRKRLQRATERLRAAWRTKHGAL